MPSVTEFDTPRTGNIELMGIYKWHKEQGKDIGNMMADAPQRAPDSPFNGHQGWESEKGEGNIWLHIFLGV